MPHDGVLELILGDPGAGKDSYVYYLINNLPFVLIQEVPNNETMDQLPFVKDTDKGIDKAYKILAAIQTREGFVDGDPAVPENHFYNFAIWSREEATDENPKIWKFMKQVPTLWLGDVNWWNKDWNRSKKFDNFVRDIRGRDQMVYGTTHRAKADLPPFVFQYARIIKWVGPFNDDPSKLKELYGKKSSGLFASEEEFDEKIRALKKFDWEHPNPDESVLTIKDLTD